MLIKRLSITTIHFTTSFTFGEVEEVCSHESGAGRSRPRIRLGLLASAKDIVESQESDDLEIVLLPTESANHGIESDEEGSDNILNEKCLPDEVSGEVAIHGEAFEDEITEKESSHRVWHKSDEVSLCDAKELQKSDEVMMHGR